MKTLEDFFWEIDEYYIHIDRISMPKLIEAVKEFLQQFKKARNEKIADWGQEAAINKILKNLTKGVKH
jgi:antitoxin component HigA of HigAB toxin-antitoxin module